MTQEIEKHMHAGYLVAFVEACWHHEIVEQARLGFMDEWHSAQAGEGQVEVFQVPGALELPLMAQRLARTGLYDAIVCAALVVDGGIYRHEFVASAVIDGLVRVQLNEDLPVFSAVLTPHQYHGHSLQYTFFHGHFLEKGREVAQACRLQLTQLSSVSRRAGGGAA